MSDLAGTWLRSTFCSDTSCVELSTLDGDVLLRDGKNTDGAVLRFSRDEWDDFRAAVMAGEFRFE
jgi:hypothetical protein